MLDELERFVTADRPCGELSAAVGELTETGYGLEIACSCEAHGSRLRRQAMISWVRGSWRSRIDRRLDWRERKARTQEFSGPSWGRFSYAQTVRESADQACAALPSRSRPGGLGPQQEASLGHHAPVFSINARLSVWTAACHRRVGHSVRPRQARSGGC